MGTEEGHRVHIYIKVMAKINYTTKNSTALGKDSEEFEATMGTDSLKPNCSHIENINLMGGFAQFG